jgi:protein phosphatase
MNVASAGDRQAPRRESARSDRSAFVREAVFATGEIRLDTAVASSRGKSHAVNEDWHSALGGTSPLFVVADGVSSGAMASSASRGLVSRLHETLERGRIDADAMRSAVLDADREVGRSIASLTNASGAATVALCAGTGTSLSRWLVAWVGDCRVYRVSAQDGAPAQLLTLDDTYRHLNEQPPPGGSLDDPARMVGNGAVDVPNVRDVDLGRDEMLLLCSDGVHKHAGPHDIARLLRGPSPLAARCLRLIEFARTSGSNDDATVLVVHRAERARARLARLVLIGALIALAAATLLLLAADWVSAQRLPATATHVKVQP